MHTSHERMKEIYAAQIKEADTYEEKIEAQNKLRQEKKKESEDYLTVLEKQIDANKRLQSYLDPDSVGFDTYTEKMVQNYKDMAQAAEDYLNKVLLVEMINDHITEINPTTGKKYTYSESMKWAMQQPEVLEQQKKITGYYDNITQTYLDATTKKVNQVQDSLDKLDKFKPQEWTSVNDISNYTEQMIAGYAKQIGLYQEALKDTANLTEE